MLKMILKLIRARQGNEDTAPTAPSITPLALADTKPRQDRRKLKRVKRRASPGTRKIDPNGPWLEQARGAKNGR
ncbi:hypothetical protein R0290_10080 [Burkholderia semiarida]|uniref:hypothetical protein n=1 Tax=Burkholderia TaxID=32008 RepID=UPI00265FEA41|nr:hypothetical protein [Burkholderia sp. AU44665]MDN7699467.1 hypothetical protein [Burkholderia sp. AU44665]